MTRQTSGKHRVFYAGGPGDLVGTFRHWCEGRDDPRQPNVTYSSQFFSACRETDVDAWAMSTCAKTDEFGLDGIYASNRARWFEHARGPFYHAARFLHGLRIVHWLNEYKPTIAFIAEGTCEWSALRFAPKTTHLVPVLHCVLWPTHQKPTAGQRLSAGMSKWLFTKRADRLLCTSHAIVRQLQSSIGDGLAPIREFVPTYRRSDFEDIPKPAVRQEGAAFSLFFAGRVEEDKGVFDLVDMAEKLRDSASEVNVQIDVCGEGGALTELRERIQARGLTDMMTCHGHCESGRLRELLGLSHAVIVPTTTSFIEGFNQVVAEGVMAYRPVITSAVCPAIEYVCEAVEEVPPNQPGAYAEAVLRLARNPQLHQARVDACTQLRNQFFDPEQSFGAAIRDSIKGILAGDVDFVKPDVKIK